MAFDFQALIDAVASDALVTGVFDAVNTHEPKVPPGNGMTCSIWAANIHPVTSSGLNVVSMLVELTARIQTPTIQQDPNQIDPLIMQAVGTLMIEFGGGFTLGGIVREVDLIGQHSSGLSAKPGYVTQNGTVYRVMDVSVPIIVNDLYTEVP